MPAANVAILLTPPGVAAIAVVRLAGERVLPFLAAHFSKPVPPGRCVHGTLRDEAGNVIDDPVVVCSDDGTVADLNVHGGAWVVQAVLQLAEKGGFEIRGAREAQMVACGADSELEREVLAYLPLARTELALRTLLSQPHAWAAFKESIDPAKLEAILADPSLVHLLDPPRVAIVGAPNVGKSTLANQLFAQERSITADVPGTTRDWVGEVANIDGLAVTLVDTPGQRETSDAIEREAIERSRAELGRADLVVLVLDASRPIEPEQRPLLRAHPDALTVINKIDRSAAWELNQRNAIRTVASTGQGVDKLRDAVRRCFGCLDVAADRPHAWTDRQRSIIARAITDPGALRDL